LRKNNFQLSAIVFQAESLADESHAHGIRNEKQCMAEGFLAKG